jgi:hypothetical protein
MCILCELEKDKKKPVSWPGRLYKVHAYQNGALVGSGYVIVDDMSGAHEPILHDLKGELLESGIFDIRITDDLPKLVTVSGSKH